MSEKFIGNSPNNFFLDVIVNPNIIFIKTIVNEILAQPHTILELHERILIFSPISSSSDPQTEKRE